MARHDLLPQLLRPLQPAPELELVDLDGLGRVVAVRHPADDLWRQLRQKGRGFFKSLK